MNSLKKEIDNTFFQTLEDLKSKENLKLFFNDFLSSKELESLTKRLAIAYWLKKGRTFENIIHNLDTKTIEIEKVEKRLKTKGFTLALKLMTAEEWANKWSVEIKKLGTKLKN